MDYEIDKLQSIEYEILKDIVAFCNANQIEYFLASGTLLGAIRHDGFIPWDDDIDISMDFNNYKKFLMLAKKSFPSQYFVQHYTTDKKYHNPWIKIHKKNTTCMDPSLSNLDIHFGICVDIFLMNGISDNRMYKRIQSFSSKVLNLLLYKHLLLSQNAELTILQKIAYRFIPDFLRLQIIKTLDRISSKDLSKCKRCYSNFYSLSDAIVFESSWYNNFASKWFHAGYYMIPKEYDKILTAIYGDWQVPPPEANRSGHGNQIVDYERSYKYYYTGKNKVRTK